jgi:DNA-binding LytR/AlgR family response regulator
MMEHREGFDRVAGRALDGTRANGAPVHERLAIRWQRRIVIVPIASIVRLEACDDHVLVCADRPYRHRETLTDLCARLPAGTMLRVHRSHAINVAAVRELEPRHHGEYALVLRDGCVVRSGRQFRREIETAFELGS